MKTQHIIFALILCTATSITACYQDYPSGRDISVYSQKNRIVGTWKWGKTEANSLNVTGKYVDWTIEFHATGKVTLCDSANINCYTGTWNFVTQKTGLQLVLSDSVMNLPAYQAVEFDIVRLTKSEVYLDFTGNKANSDEGIVLVNPIYWELTREQ